MLWQLDSGRLCGFVRGFDTDSRFKQFDGVMEQKYDDREPNCWTYCESLDCDDYN